MPRRQPPANDAEPAAPQNGAGAGAAGQDAVPAEGATPPPRPKKKKGGGCCSKSQAENVEVPGSEDQLASEDEGGPSQPEPAPYSQEPPMVEPTTEELTHDNERLRTKVQTLAGMLAVTNDLLSIEQEKVEALKWELLVSMKIGANEQQAIVDRLEMHMGTGPDWDQIPKSHAYSTLALLLAGNTDDYKQDIPTDPDASVEDVADAILLRAGPGLRKDYVMALVRGLPANDQETSKVDLKGLWRECRKVRQAMRPPEPADASAFETKANEDEGKSGEGKDGEESKGGEGEGKDGEEGKDGAGDGDQAAAEGGAGAGEGEGEDAEAETDAAPPKKGKCSIM